MHRPGSNIAVFAESLFWSQRHPQYRLHLFSYGLGLSGFGLKHTRLLITKAGQLYPRLTSLMGPYRQQVERRHNTRSFSSSSTSTKTPNMTTPSLSQLQASNTAATRSLRRTWHRIAHRGRQRAAGARPSQATPQEAGVARASVPLNATAAS